MIAMEMRTFDHDGKRWWVVGDDRGAVSISAIIVPADFTRPTAVRNPYGPGQLYPECVTYHRPVPGTTDGAHSDCPALDGRWCDPDAGQTAVYILLQWQMLACHDEYLANTLTELHAREWPAATPTEQAGR